MTEDIAKFESVEIPNENEFEILDKNSSIETLKKIAKQLAVYKDLDDKQSYVDKYNIVFSTLGTLIKYTVLSFVFIPWAMIFSIILVLCFDFAKGFWANFSIVLSISFTLPFILGFLYGLILSIGNKKKCNDYKYELDSINSNAKFKNERDVFFSKSLSLLGPNYITPHAVERFVVYFENGRCKTLQEAKNLYETEITQQQMNAKLNEAIEEAQEANTAAKKASSKASDARMFSFFNMFK